jgi:hypothetical protein
VCVQGERGWNTGGWGLGVGVGEWGVRGGAELLYDEELWYDESRDEDFEELRFERWLAKIKK